MEFLILLFGVFVIIMLQKTPNRRKDLRMAHEVLAVDEKRTSPLLKAKQEAYAFKLAFFIAIITIIFLLVISYLPKYGEKSPNEVEKANREYKQSEK